MHAIGGLHEIASAEIPVGHQYLEPGRSIAARDTCFVTQPLHELLRSRAVVCVAGYEHVGCRNHRFQLLGHWCGDPADLFFSSGNPAREEQSASAHQSTQHVGNRSRISLRVLRILWHQHRASIYERRGFGDATAGESRFGELVAQKVFEG